MIITVMMMSVVGIVTLPRSMVITVRMVIEPDPWWRWRRRSPWESETARGTTAPHGNFCVTSIPGFLAFWSLDILTAGDPALVLLSSDSCNDRTNIKVLTFIHFLWID